MVSTDDLGAYKSHIGFSKKPLLALKNSRWRISAILKIVKSPYLNEKSSDIYELWYTNENL